MSNHTPGPWQLSYGVLGACVWAGDPANPIIVSDRSNSDEDALANGRLIAAAPEMYESIKSTECPHPANDAPDSTDWTVRQCVDRGDCGCDLGAALRKAEGQAL